ncbi:MAG: hypothetical protein HYY18_18255, partial [Planctomycetes bacterium]|nr:hypothetical protein [Planctomycetota bacterium]
MAAPVRALLQHCDRTLSIPTLLALSASTSAAFGAAVGAWTGGRQILYAALKMPLFLFATLALSFAALHVLAASRFPARITLSIAAETIAVTAVVLGALAPVAALFSLA